MAITSRSTLALSSGKYFFTSLDLDPHAVLTLDQEHGPVSLSVETVVFYRGSVTDPSQVPTNIDLTVLGTSAVSIESPFLGVLRAPNAKVTLASLPAGHTGEFFARDIEVSPHINVVAEPFTCIVP